MDYQQRQFEVRPEQEVFDNGKKFETVADRDVRAVGERVVDLNGKAVESLAIRTEGANRVEMLTPADMGLVETGVTVDNDGGDAMDFSVISNDRSDRLNEKAIEQVIGCEKELGKDGDVEKFYGKVVEMKKALLKNNYGREIGEKVV